MIKLKKSFFPLIVAISFLLSACSTGGLSSDDSSGGDYGAEYSAQADLAGESSGLAADSVARNNGEDVESADSVEYVIKTASVTLQVEDVEVKLDEVRGVAKDHSGNIEYSETRIRDREMRASSLSRHGDYYPIPVEPVGDYAYLTLSVPVENLDPFLADVRALGSVVTDSTAENDVTLDVLGLEAQIDSETASLTRLEELLNRANSVDDVLSVEREIQNRKNNISSMLAQMNSLKNRAAESTVTVQLVTDKAVELSPEEMNWFEKTWDKIADGSSDTVAYSLIIVIFLLPLLGLLFAVKALLDRWAAHRRRKNPELFNRAPSAHPAGPVQPVPAAKESDAQVPETGTSEADDSLKDSQK